MRERLRVLEERFAELSLRERALVLAAGLAVMFVVWDSVVLRPMQGRSAQVEADGERLEEQVRLLDSRQAELERALSSDPHRDRREAIEALRADLARVDDELRERTSDLISPQRMASVLEELLASAPALRVARIEALPSEPLLVPDEESGEQGETAEASFYRHGLRIELEGSFHETLAFLDEIERVPGSFVWDRVHYEVTEYPTAKVTLTVFMLGSREGWIGV